MVRRAVWWWSRKIVGAVLAFLGLAGALGMPQDILTWLRCAFFIDCDPLVASMPLLREIDQPRVTRVALILIGVALLSPLPEYLGRHFRNKRTTTAPPVP